MNARDIMSQPVVTVTPDTTIAEAAELMITRRISGLPVVDETGAVVGLVTEGDLLRRAETGTEKRHSRWAELLLGPGRLARDYVHSHGRKVGEIMTTRVHSVGPETELADIVSIMESRHIKRVPVIEDGRLVGIVSRANLIAALMKLLPTEAAGAPPAGQDDEAIREHILAVIAREPWGPRASIDVTVKNGVVDLYGTIIDDAERAAVKVVAENTAGVTEVHDHLVWVEPVSGIIIPADRAKPPG
jgi:CBS domain-containing protein